MNPNQQYHVPESCRRHIAAAQRIARYGGSKIFARPAKDAVVAARKLYRVAKNTRMRHLNQEIVASIPETSAGSELDIFADDATVHQNLMNGLHGSLIDGHLRIVCNYANEWHQRKDPTRNYTGVSVSSFLADCLNDNFPMKDICR